MSDTTAFQPQSTEPHWQAMWEKKGLFQNTEDQLRTTEDRRAKEYLLFAFAYPSGSGLHVGHVESKTALDILARYKRMSGKKVFFPVGWDAFGLPAENYAIKTGIHPAKTTIDAIHTFRRQIKRLGISYDWANELATNHPEYYRWTQWIFLQLYKKGLAYRGTGVVNWCPSCQTVLANEQVVTGKCERCGTQVIQKELEQWYFKITDYKEELLSGLDQVDWPTATKQQQIHWIGKKEGITISYPVVGVPKQTIQCFSTRPDTNFGATFVVLAPEHPFVRDLLDGKMPLTSTQRRQVELVREYVQRTQEKTELERMAEGRKKTGVFTGFSVTNRLNGEALPVWISDFVLVGFGTGAVVGVPGHDMRDFQFAQAMGIPVRRVVIGPDGDATEITTESQIQEDEGVMCNSGFLDGMTIQEAIPAMMDHLEKEGMGKRVTTYKLRDWLISRQRYWGAPIPIVYDPQGKPHPVKEEHLPWRLPDDVDFKPTGESPLKSSKEFFERTERLYGKGWKPECDTMDTFVDSSWYFLRYVSSRNTNVFLDPDQAKKWLPVDLYLIGPEHIVLHLLYSRFFTKFLRDEGYLSFDEPFLKMRHQGMILGPDGKKMSKSKGNVINPDEIIEKFGADTLRLYEMFMGPLESDKPWDTGSVIGVYRLLQRIHSLVTTVIQASEAGKHSKTGNESLQRALHQTLKKVTEDLASLKFNTAIAALMILVNAWEGLAAEEQLRVTKADLEKFIKMLAPFAPFLAEELYQRLQGSQDIVDVTSFESVHELTWPHFDAKLAEQNEVVVVIQVNGKLRGDIRCSRDEAQEKETMLHRAQSAPGVERWLLGKKIIKSVFVPGKLINFVVA